MEILPGDGHDIFIGKAAVLIRVSTREAVGLAFQPMFIFRQRHVTTQAFLTLGIALSSREAF